jgi:hypothetical protein
MKFNFSGTLVANDVTIKISDDISVDKLKINLSDYAEEFFYKFNVLKFKEFLEKWISQGEDTTDIYISNGCDDLIFGLIVHSFLFKENIEIIEFEY